MTRREYKELLDEVKGLRAVQEGVKSASDRLCVAILLFIALEVLGRGF